MNEGSKALFEILIDRIVLGLMKVLKKKGPTKKIVEPNLLLPSQKPLTVLRERKRAKAKKWEELPRDEELMTSLETLVQKVAKRIKALSAVKELNEEH